MDDRKKMRWRRSSQMALGNPENGALSLLEYRYVHRVERPHGLPAARRQARIRQRTGNRYLDNLYKEFGVCAELDGTAAHPADEQWRDKRRDNANAVQGIVTLRFGFLDLGDRRCGPRRASPRAPPGAAGWARPRVPPPSLLQLRGDFMIVASFGAIRPELAMIMNGFLRRTASERSGARVARGA